MLFFSFLTLYYVRIMSCWILERLHHTLLGPVGELFYNIYIFLVY